MLFCAIKLDHFENTTVGQCAVYLRLSTVFNDVYNTDA